MECEVGRYGGSVNGKGVPGAKRTVLVKEGQQYLLGGEIGDRASKVARQPAWDG